MIIISWCRTFVVQFQALAYSVNDTIRPCIDGIHSSFLFFCSRFDRILSLLFLKLNRGCRWGENLTELPVPTYIFKKILSAKYIKHNIILKMCVRETFFNMDAQISSSKDFFNRMPRIQNHHSSNSGLNLNILVISHCSNKLMHLRIHQLFIMSFHEQSLGSPLNVTNGTRIWQK